MKSDKSIQVINEFVRTQPAVLWCILVTITLFSTLVLYPDRGKINYDYKFGDIAERDIKAPRDFFIEDQEATQLNRQQVIDSFRSIYDYDPNMSSQLSEKVEQAFAIPRKLFAKENQITEINILPQVEELKSEASEDKNRSSQIAANPITANPTSTNETPTNQTSKKQIEVDQTSKNQNALTHTAANQTSKKQNAVTHTAANQTSKNQNAANQTEVDQTTDNRTISNQTTKIQTSNNQFPEPKAEQDSIKKNKNTAPSIEMIMETREEFENILGIPVDEKSYSILYKYNFDKNITDSIQTILTDILKNGVVANKELLLKEEKKGITLRIIGSSKEQVVENLKTFYGPDEYQIMVKNIGDSILKGMNRNLGNLIVDMCQKLIIPNITMNRNETETQLLQAQNDIKPVLYQIKQGEMILREGERVDKTKIVKLKALSNQIEEKNTVITRIGTAFIILFAILVIYIVLLKDHKKLNKYHNKNILFLSLMLMIFLSITKISAPIAAATAMNLPMEFSSESIFLVLPLAAGAMTVSLFLGFEIAIYFTLVLSILGSIIFSSRIEIFIFFLLSSIVGAFWMKECRERKIFIITGFKLALFNTGLAIALSIYSADIQIISLAKNIMLAALGGLTAGIITAGLIPVAEIVFSYTTEIKFLELANLDQPIMKRLMIETPGTYNHSVIVSNLAEAAASAIGVSALKTKVGAFYHDIGKLNKPLYFVENQTDGINRHDKISPSMSALVLIQHTKKGVEIAKEYKLGQDIMDTIQQHHGTSLIRYFYNKSVKIHGFDAVKESDFRYPGPKPQTRESAIVMLADVVEAALRTLERPTSSRIQGRVQELINAIFLDGQLEECELTLKDLHQIATSFTKILTGLYHQRIEYTDKPQDPKKESKSSNESKKEKVSEELQKDKALKEPQKENSLEELKKEHSLEESKKNKTLEKDKTLEVPQNYNFFENIKKTSKPDENTPKSHEKTPTPTSHEKMPKPHEKTPTSHEKMNTSYENKKEENDTPEHPATDSTKIGQDIKGTDNPKNRADIKSSGL
ncbi:MAG: HDIG domain-containing protein [Desulfamplus sp.]|nr:HDIG domain-containing protein [Desulfamplus sp.]